VTTEQRNGPQLSILYSTFLFVVLIGTAEEKSILLSRMTMHVTVQKDFSFPLQVSDYLLCVKDRWMQILIWMLPFSI